MTKSKEPRDPSFGHWDLVIGRFQRSVCGQAGVIIGIDSTGTSGKVGKRGTGGIPLHPE
jgi:hypothetical protein